jgi:hypothetical protein
MHAFLQDQPNAMSSSEVSEALSLSTLKKRTYSIFKTSAINGDGLTEAMDWCVVTKCMHFLTQAGPAYFHVALQACQCTQGHPVMCLVALLLGNRFRLYFLHDTKISNLFKSRCNARRRGRAVVRHGGGRVGGGVCNGDQVPLSRGGVDLTVTLVHARHSLGKTAHNLQARKKGMSVKR